MPYSNTVQITRDSPHNSEVPLPCVKGSQEESECRKITLVTFRYTIANFNGTKGTIIRSMNANMEYHGTESILRVIGLIYLIL